MYLKKQNNNQNGREVYNEGILKTFGSLDDDIKLTIPCQIYN